MVLDPGLAQCIERVPMGLGSRPTCGPLPLVFPLFSLTPLSCHFFTESNNKVDKDPQKKAVVFIKGSVVVLQASDSALVFKLKS